MTAFLVWLCFMGSYIAYQIGRAGGAVQGYERGWKEGSARREVEGLEELFRR